MESVKIVKLLNFIVADWISSIFIISKNWSSLQNYRIVITQLLSWPVTNYNWTHHVSQDYSNKCDKDWIFKHFKALRGRHPILLYKQLCHGEQEGMVLAWCWPIFRIFLGRLRVVKIVSLMLKDMKLWPMMESGKLFLVDILF